MKQARIGVRVLNLLYLYIFILPNPSYYTQNFIARKSWLQEKADITWMLAQVCPG